MKLRPKYFNDIVGQSDTINRLKILINSAKQRHDSLPHILFDGPPGLGKTSVTNAIIKELDADVLWVMVQGKVV